MAKSIGVIAILLVSSSLVLFLADANRESESIALDPSLPRVTFQAGSPSVARVAAAEWVGNRLYLLDTSLHQVAVQERTETGWTEVSVFGTKGDGPGEFRWPQDILWDPEIEELLVLSANGRVHHFTADGVHIRDETIYFPCTLPRGTLARRPEGGFWVSGNCTFPATSGDTVFAVVAGEGADGEWRVFAKRPRLTLDGRFGTAFGVQRPVATDGSRLFLNAGNDLCFDVLAAPSSDQTEVCFDGPRFRAPEPEGFGAGPGPSRQALAWPDPLPALSGLAARDGRLFFMRLFSADSLFLESRRFDEPEAEGEMLAVGSHAEFVGCRGWGCLWFRTDSTGIQIGHLLFSDLEEDLVNGGAVADVR